MKIENNASLLISFSLSKLSVFKDSRYFVNHFLTYYTSLNLSSKNYHEKNPRNSDSKYRGITETVSLVCEPPYLSFACIRKDMQLKLIKLLCVSIERKMVNC